MSKDIIIETEAKIGERVKDIVAAIAGRNHVAFYRIENESQGFELGLEDYFESGSLCLMEWPENVESLLPDDTLYIRIRVGADESRIVTITE